MNRVDAFRVLEIAPVKDKKIIKKAYASLVKQYHPDDYPEKWKELHDAYEIALIYAKEAKREEDNESSYGQSGHYGRTNEQLSDKDWQEISDESAEDLQEMGKLFEQIEDLSADAKQQKEKELKENLAEAMALLWEMRSRGSNRVKDWKVLFENPKYELVVGRDDFLLECARTFEGKSMPKKLYVYLKTQLDTIARYQACNQAAGEKNGTLAAVNALRKRVDSMYAENKGKWKLLNWKTALFIICLRALMPVFLGESENAESQKPAISAPELNVTYPGVIRSEETETNDAEPEDWEVDAAFYEWVLQAELLENEETVEEQLAKIEDGALMQDGIYLSKWKLSQEADKERYKVEELAIADVNGFSGESQNASNTRIFSVIGPDTEGAVFFCFKPQMLGLSENCRIYCLDGEQYEEITKWGGTNTSNKARYWYQIRDYRVIVVKTVSKDSAEKYPIIITDD